MNIKRWDYEKQEFVPCIVPDEWNISCMEDDISKKINCVDCGRLIEYGRTYSSYLYFNEFEVPYCNCPDCHVKRQAQHLEVDPEGLMNNARGNHGLSVIYFANKKAFDHAMELKKREADDEIFNLRFNPDFTLRDAYINSDGEYIKSVIFKADFSYNDRDSLNLHVEFVAPDPDLFESMKTHFYTLMDGLEIIKL